MMYREDDLDFAFFPSNEVQFENNFNVSMLRVSLKVTDEVDRCWLFLK